MRGKYELREWEKPHLKTKFEKWIKSLQSGNVKKIDLTHEDISPHNAEEILEELGWMRMDEDDNYHDFWFFYEKDKWILSLAVNVEVLSFDMVIEENEDYLMEEMK